LGPESLKYIFSIVVFIIVAISGILPAQSKLNRLHCIG